MRDPIGRAFARPGKNARWPEGGVSVGALFGQILALRLVFDQLPQQSDFPVEPVFGFTSLKRM